jgi:hypothetical protein
MTVTVVSANYGAYDQPVAPPEQDCDVTWVMVNDGEVQPPAPWKSIVEPRTHLHPRMAAKIPKCLPHRYADSDVVIWLDSSAIIRRSDFVSECVAALGDGDVAMWTHPQRDCILPEADVSAGMEKYATQPVQAQASHYLTHGHTERFGLWATGCMVWRQQAQSYDIGHDWLAEQTVWTYQDQISWPVIVRRYEIDVRPLPGTLWDQQRLTFRPHVSGA